MLSILTQSASPKTAILYLHFYHVFSFFRPLRKALWVKTDIV